MMAGSQPSQGQGMKRLIGGTIAGLIAWITIVTILNLGLRYGWPAYAAVEKTMLFTLSMMAARLAMSGFSSLAAGYIAASVGKGGPAPLVSGAFLLLMFLPVHYNLWAKFPAWYHLTFLTSLPLLAWAGSTLWRPRLATAT
jgi:hypothetical protein